MARGNTKFKLGKQNKSNLFKSIGLLGLILFTFYFIYNYLITGSFDLRPSAVGISSSCALRSQADCNGGCVWKSSIRYESVPCKNITTQKPVTVITGYKCSQAGLTQYKCSEYGFDWIPIKTTQYFSETECVAQPDKAITVYSCTGTPTTFTTTTTTSVINNIPVTAVAPVTSKTPVAVIAPSPTTSGGGGGSLYSLSQNTVTSGQQYSNNNLCTTTKTVQQASNRCIEVYGGGDPNNCTSDSMNLGTVGVWGKVRKWGLPFSVYKCSTVKCCVAKVAVESAGDNICGRYNVLDSNNNVIPNKKATCELNCPTGSTNLSIGVGDNYRIVTSLEIACPALSTSGEAVDNSARCCVK